MTISKKLLALMCALGLSVSSLAGCSGSGKEASAPTTHSTPSKEPTSASPTPTPSPTPTKKEYTPASWQANWTEPKGELIRSTQLTESGIQLDVYARVVKMDKDLYGGNIDWGSYHDGEDISSWLPTVKAGTNLLVLDLVATPLSGKYITLNIPGGGVVTHDTDHFYYYMHYDNNMPVIIGGASVVWNNCNQAKGSCEVNPRYKNPVLSEIIGEPRILTNPLTNDFLKEHDEADEMAAYWAEGESIVLTAIFTEDEVMEEGNFSIPIIVRVVDDNDFTRQEVADGKVQVYVLFNHGFDTETYDIDLPDAADMVREAVANS